MKNKKRNKIEKLYLVISTSQDYYGRMCAVCTDGRLAMLVSKSGFVARTKVIASWVTVTHCVIHRQALASRTLAGELQAILANAIKTVNNYYVKSTPVNMTSEFCKF